MLKQVAILAVMPRVLIGCVEERTTTRRYNYCDASNAMKVSDFVQQCVRIATSAPDNSVDDVEDVIEQCEEACAHRGLRSFSGARIADSASCSSLPASPLGSCW